MLCEYAHAMGNSGGGLADYWDKFWSPAFPRLQGGFIWDWVDQGLVLGANTSGCYGYGGDFGDLPNSKQFCINGILGPDRVPHPIALEAAALQAPLTVMGHIVLGCAADGDDTGGEMEEGKGGSSFQLVVHNRRSFVSLADITLSVSLGCSYTSSCATTSTAVSVSPSVKLHLKDYPSILPQASGEFSLLDPQAGEVFSLLVRSLVAQVGPENAPGCFTSPSTEYWLEVTATSSGGSLSPHTHEVAHTTLQPSHLSALTASTASPMIEPVVSSSASTITSSTVSGSGGSGSCGSSRHHQTARVYKLSHSIDAASGDIAVVWGVSAGRAVVGGACGRLLHYAPAGLSCRVIFCHVMSCSVMSLFRSVVFCSVLLCSFFYILFAYAVHTGICTIIILILASHHFSPPTYVSSSTIPICALYLHIHTYTHTHICRSRLVYGRCRHGYEWSRQEWGGGRT